MKKNKSGDKIFDVKDASSIREKHPKARIVLAGGCFDIFHYGHLSFLNAAKKEGDVLVILLEPDVFIEKRKMRKPTHTQLQRAHILSALNQTDVIVLLPHFTKDEHYDNLVFQIKPNVIAVTEEDEYYHHKKRQALKTGAELKVVAPRITQFSSTNSIDYAAVSRD